MIIEPMLTGSAEGHLAALRQPRRAVRIARALWIVWAIVVWNVVFDHVIEVAGRQYIVAATSASGSGPFAPMDDWMRPAVTRALWTASAAGVAILVVGLILIGLVAGRLPPRPSQSA